MTHRRIGHVALFCLLASCGSTSEPNGALDGGFSVPAESSLDANGPVSASVNGVAEAFGTNDAAFYTVSEDGTSIIASAGSSQGITLFVPGNQAGTFGCGSGPDGGVDVGMTFSQVEATYSTTNDATLTPCTIVITQYGAVGSIIVGTFTGTLVATSRIGAEPSQVSILSGQFTVTRGPDH
jgi:hypothetical protein